MLSTVVRGIGVGLSSCPTINNDAMIIPKMIAAINTKYLPREFLFMIGLHVEYVCHIEILAPQSRIL